MADIDVDRDGDAFRVRVSEGRSTTEHLVTVSDDTLVRLGAGFPNAQELIRASFEFLLAREPKEQILREFDLDVISRYFPEYEGEIGP